MAGDPVTISPTLARDLTQWADTHCPKGATATRKALDQEERQRCLGKLDALWWTWGARIWAGWTPEARRIFNARTDELEAAGSPPREAARTAFIELLSQGAAAA